MGAGYLNNNIYTRWLTSNQNSEIELANGYTMEHSNSLPSGTSVFVTLTGYRAEHWLY